MNTVTSYDKLNEILNDLRNQHINDDLKNAVNKYYKGDYDLAVNKLLEKLDLINKQEVNKDCFIVYADTNKLKSSFNYPNIALYNYVLLNNDESINFIVNNIDKYNFTEHNYTNYSRLFFDIDFKDINKIEDLEKLFNLIHELQDKYNLKAYGICELNETLKDYDFIFEWSEDDGIYFFKNNEINKLLTGHIYLNGYCERYKIMNYMKYLKDNKGLGDTFDITVYKTTKQALRMSYSPKIETDKARYISDKLIDYVKNNKDIIKNLRMAPCDSDKYIDLPSVETNVISKSSTIKKVNGEELEDSEDKDVSICQYIMYNKIFDNIKEVVKGGYIDSCYELTQKLYMFKSLPLSVEEFNEEFNNLEFDETEGFNKEVIEGLKAKTLKMMNYKQDFKSDKTLYIYKGYLYDKLEEIKKECKELEDNIKDNEEYKLIMKIINKYNYYIERYEKKCFVYHDYYDILKTFKNDVSKDYKIIYNCYKTVENEKAIYYPYLNKTFANITQFRNYFKLNGTKANEIFDKLVCFDNEQEFKVKRIKHDYNKLNNDNVNIINDKLKLFLKYFGETFKNEEDYKFYLSYYSMKLNKRTTLNKGLINQGTETAGAHNSLKTYFNDLLNNYLNIVSADVNNINKALNGGYFIGDLCVIEETPKHIKDINNLINILKMYSSKEYLTLELKGCNPITVENKCDIIINSNHTLANLFNNKLDCEALLKRFKIIQRVSLNSEYFNKGHELNELLDYIKGNNMFKYALYKYVLNYGSDDYYKYKNVYNHIEDLYKSSSIEENTNDKLQTKLNFNDWIDEFKRYYINPKNNNIVISRLLNSLTSLKSYKEMQQKTLKIILIRLLTEENNGSIKISDKNGIIMTKATLEDYKKIYNYFYEYTGEDVEPCEKSEISEVEL